jgi:hypothetical protein
MTRLSDSVALSNALLKNANLAADATVRELLCETFQRRSLDLSDLTPGRAGGSDCTTCEVSQSLLEKPVGRALS